MKKIVTDVNPMKNVNVFAIYNETCVCKTVTHEFEHRVYMKKNYNINSKEYDSLIRGCIKDGEILFYNKSLEDIVDMPESVFNKIMEQHMELYKENIIKLYT